MKIPDNSIICANVAQIISGNHRYQYQYNITVGLNKTCSYILIFADYQNNELRFLEKNRNINILFKSEQCANMSDGHYGSKNTVVVFELNECYPDGKSSTL